MDLDELSLDLLLSDFLRQFSFEYKPGKATTTPQSGHWCCRLFHFQLVAQLSQKPNYYLPNYRFSQSLRGAISSVMVAGSTDADQFVATLPKKEVIPLLYNLCPPHQKGYLITSITSTS